jgi:hypothetical protein
MELVIVESPFAGDTERYLRYLRDCLADCLRRGESPFASHGLYTQEGVLDDHVPEERQKGIEAGYAWWRGADKIVFYTDLGWSPGMLRALERVQVGVPPEGPIRRMLEYEVRVLGGDWGESAWPAHLWHDCSRDGHVGKTHADSMCMVCDGGLGGCILCGQWEGEIVHPSLCPGVPASSIENLQVLLRYHYEVAPVFRQALPGELRPGRLAVVFDLGAWQYPGRVLREEVWGSDRWLVECLYAPEALSVKREYGPNHPGLGVYDPFTAGDYRAHVVELPMSGERWCTLHDTMWAHCDCPGPHDDDDDLELACPST